MSLRSLTWFLIVLAVACALAVGASPHLDVALTRQYELAAERPYDAAVQNDLGNLLLLVHRDDEAEQAYRRALELDGGHRAARFNLGLLLQAKGEHDAAIEEFARLLEIDPRHAWAHYQTGVSLQETGRRKAAIEHYAQAFGIDPTLSFAENNPHVIDNTMMTEALLLSSRYGSTARRAVAREYDDAERIAQLMLDAEQSPATASGEAAGTAEAAAQPAADGATPLQTRDTASGTGAKLDSTAVEPAAEEAQEAEDEDRRVITEDDLRGVQVGGAVGPGSATTREQPHPNRGVDPRKPRSYDGRSLDDVRSGQAPPSNLGSQRYRPARRSTASLDLKLLPEEGIG